MILFDMAHYLKLCNRPFIIRDKDQIKSIRDAISRPAKKASDFKYIWDDEDWINLHKK
jgi:hypothetical protein